MVFRKASANRDSVCALETCWPCRLPWAQEDWCVCRAHWHPSLALWIITWGGGGARGRAKQTRRNNHVTGWQLPLIALNMWAAMGGDRVCISGSGGVVSEEGQGKGRWAWATLPFLHIHIRETPSYTAICRFNNCYCSVFQKYGHT